MTPHPLTHGLPPPWASAWGEDNYGPFVELRLGDAEQRFRWLTPGSFWMGSPEGEAGRDSDEARHRVTLTRGFWLADTPCTQALWEAVMGKNPSRFESPDRPVERVSWDDCQEFLARANARVPGLAARLPTEAEWEYACRAGTETATYAGNLTILGANHAPELDRIAWYGGNSGEGFELTDGVDSSTWQEKQYNHRKAGSRRVKTRDPNAWGLYDTLGNVWEWCADWYGSYKEELDPTGPARGSHRVIRGGSWSDDARDVRAAYRDRIEPSYRWINLGFRFALGQPALQPASGSHSRPAARSADGKPRGARGPG